MFNRIVITACENASYIKKNGMYKMMVSFSKNKQKLSVLELQQREHSSCPLLGFLFSSLLSTVLYSSGVCPGPASSISEISLSLPQLPIKVLIAVFGHISLFQ